MSQNNSQRGSLLLEMLVATSLLLAALGLITKMILNHFTALRSLEMRQSILEKLWIAEESVLRSSLKSSAYWGSKNIAVNPQKIDFREVDPRIYLRVIDSSKSSIHKTYNLCGYLPSEPKLSELQLWIALTPDGYYTLKGHLTRVSISSLACAQNIYKGSFEIYRHSSFPPQCYFCENGNELTNKHPFALIAVLDEYSIYVDNNDTLRIESQIKQLNQPVVSGISSIDTRPGPLQGTSIITFRINNSAGEYIHELILTSNYNPLVGLEMLP